MNCRTIFPPRFPYDPSQAHPAGGASEFRSSFSSETQQTPIYAGEGAYRGDTLSCPSTPCSVADSIDFENGFSIGSMGSPDASPLAQTNALFRSLVLAKGDAPRDRFSESLRLCREPPRSATSSIARDPESPLSGLQEEESLHLDIWQGCKQQTLQSILRASPLEAQMFIIKQSHRLDVFSFDQIQKFTRFWDHGLLATSSMHWFADFIQVLALLPTCDWSLLRRLQEINYLGDKRVAPMSLFNLTNTAFALRQLPSEQREALVTEVQAFKVKALPWRVDEMICVFARQGYTPTKVQAFFTFCADKVPFDGGRGFDFLNLIDWFSKSLIDFQ